MAAFKVKLDDGVEVGPLDVEMLRSWYQQGMIHAKSQVRPAGKKNWVRLSDVADISDWEDPRGGSSSGDDDGDVFEDLGPQTWRQYLVAALFFSGAAASTYFLFFPDRWLPALAGAPWREIALGFALLGLMLVRGWETTRKVVRVVVCILTFSVFPLAGLVLFHYADLSSGIRFPNGVPLAIIAILVSAWVVGSAIFFLLAGHSLRWPGIALCLFWIVAGALTIGYFGFVPPGTSPPIATSR